MIVWALVSCGKSKVDHKTEAKNLYTGALFQKASAYAERYMDYRILSAKYGLLHPEAWVEPYDMTLLTMGKAERIKWAREVADDLEANNVGGVVIMAGRAYREFLVPELEARGIIYNVPMKGLGIGEQLAWLKHELEESK